MSFDLLAPHYRWLEAVLAANKLQRCRTAFLDRVAVAKNVLIAGEGNGRFLTECRRALPAARITVVESSLGMLNAAARRLAVSGLSPDGIEFVHSDLLGWRPRPHTFDLIVTHFFLDCFPAAQLKRAVHTLADAATDNSTWLLADFRIPARGLKRYRAEAIHQLMYTFFRAITRLPARVLTPPDLFLIAQGFCLRERRVCEWGLLQSDLWMR